MWDDIDRGRVERGARLADALDTERPSAAAGAELRMIEDALGLSRAGRQRLKIELPGESPGAAKPSTPELEFKPSLNLAAHKRALEDLHKRVGATPEYYRHLNEYKKAELDERHEWSKAGGGLADLEAAKARRREERRRAVRSTAA